MVVAVALVIHQALPGLSFDGSLDSSSDGPPMGKGDKDNVGNAEDIEDMDKLDNDIDNMDKEDSMFRLADNDADVARKTLGLIEFDCRSGPELKHRIDELLRIKQSVQVRGASVWHIGIVQHCRTLAQINEHKVI